MKVILGEKNYFDEDILKLRKEFEKNEKSIYDY